MNAVLEPIAEVPQGHSRVSQNRAPQNPASQNSGSQDAVASLCDVTKRYRSGVTALDHLALELLRGEIVVLLGPNGAGKSTAVKLMMGLTSPSAGQARIFGADPCFAGNRQRTGVMLQVGRAPEMLRVREHIEIMRGYYPQPLSTAEIMRAASLEGLENRMFGQLHSTSGDGRA